MVNLKSYWAVFYHSTTEPVASDHLGARNCIPYVCLQKQTISFSISGNTTLPFPSDIPTMRKRTASLKLDLVRKYKGDQGNLWLLLKNSFHSTWAPVSIGEELFTITKGSLFLFLNMKLFANTMWRL